MFFFWGWWKCSKTGYRDGCITLWTYKWYLTVCSKWMNFLLIKLRTSKHQRPSLPCSVGSHALCKASNIVRNSSYPLKGPCGKELWPTTNRRHKPATHVSGPSWKRMLQPYSSLQVTAAPVNLLTETSWETPSQNHPYMPL